MPQALTLPPAPPAPPSALTAPPPALADSLRSPHSDLWTWRAVYADGAVLDEMDDDGYDVHGFADIEQVRLVAFQLLPLREGLPAGIVLLGPPPSPRRLIFTRRRRVELTFGGQEVSRSTVHLIGWQQTVNGQNLKSLAYYLADGRVIQTADDQLSLDGSDR